MKTYTFTIYGNQENRIGNPIPYHRTTQGSFWNKGSKRYLAWKEYVQATFMEAMKSQITSQEHNLLERMIFRHGKPIALDNEEAEMMVDIYWKNEAHADGDNIFKGIADALYVNDKNVWRGAFKGILAGDKKGRVEVAVKITDKHVPASVEKSKNK